MSVAKLLVIVMMCCSLAGIALGDTIVVNTFDGGQTPPPGASGPNAPAAGTVVDGVHALGVTFGFSEAGIASTAALYGDSIGTTGFALAPLSDPVLDGPGDGVLTLTFDSPSTFLSFDVAFTDPSGSGGTVTINGVGMPFSTTGNVGFMSLFSIGNFSWTPATPFTQATIAFSDSSSNEFAIDNLSYSDPVTTPEPTTVGLLGGGMLALVLAARKRR